MTTKVVPTKANLLKTKASLEFTEKGYSLLDRKRTVLIREMMSLNGRAMKIQDEIDNEFIKSYKLIEEASITLGSSELSAIVNSIEKEDEYDIVFETVMGVEIPRVKFKKEDKTSMQLGLHESNTVFDEASLELGNMLRMIYELAEIETSVFRLASEIKKTQKRANALDKIQIPRYQETVKEIEDILGEKEREDFFRLKKVKNKKARAKKKEESATK